MVRARKRKISDGPDVNETEQHCVCQVCAQALSGFISVPRRKLCVIPVLPTTGKQKIN